MVALYEMLRNIPVLLWQSKRLNEGKNFSFQLNSNYEALKVYKIFQ